MQKLKARVLAEDLRALVGDFVNFCGNANTGFIIAHKDDTPQELEAVINSLSAQLGTRYEDLIERLGAYIRSELGRS